MDKDKFNEYMTTMILTKDASNIDDEFINQISPEQIQEFYTKLIELHIAHTLPFGITIHKSKALGEKRFSVACTGISISIER